MYKGRQYYYRANYDAEWVPPDLNVDREPQPEEHDIEYDSGITHWCVLEPKMIRRNSMLNFGQNIAHTGKSERVPRNMFPIDMC